MPPDFQPTAGGPSVDTMTEARLLTTMSRVEHMSSDIAEIKGTMAKVAEAVSKLAIVEERQTSDRAEIARIFKRLDSIDDRLKAIELSQPLQKQATDWVGKAVWAVVAAVLSAAISMVVVSKSVAKASDVPVLTMPTK